jgi:tetratricopeptide (TPR) repeat protein
MRNLIFILIVIGLFSCNSNKEKNPDYNPKAIELNNKAGKLSQNFKKDSALILYDQAIKLDGSYYLPHSNKIGIYLGMNEYDNALYESEMVIKKKPDLAEGCFFAGLLNEHQGNDKKAMTNYRKSIQILTDRINNPDKRKDINANKLNQALEVTL